MRSRSYRYAINIQLTLQPWRGLLQPWRGLPNRARAWIFFVFFSFFGKVTQGNNTPMEAGSLEGAHGCNRCVRICQKLCVAAAAILPTNAVNRQGVRCAAVWRRRHAAIAKGLAESPSKLLACAWDGVDVGKELRRCRGRPIFFKNSLASATAQINPNQTLPKSEERGQVMFVFAQGRGWSPSVRALRKFLTMLS